MQVQKISSNIPCRVHSNTKSSKADGYANAELKNNVKNNNNSNVNFKGLTPRGKYLTGALLTFFGGLGCLTINLAMIPVSLACWAFTGLFLSAVKECDDEDFYRGTYRDNMWK